MAHRALQASPPASTSSTSTASPAHPRRRMSTVLSGSSEDEEEQLMEEAAAAPASPPPPTPPPAPAPPAQLLLPEPWRSSLPPEQHEWVSRALFVQDQTGRTVLNNDLQLWYHPPGPRRRYQQPPASPDAFFQRPFFLWVPYKMWQCHIKCPVCTHRMTGCGLYKTVRKVLDADGWYFMGTEYLECRRCRKKLASWGGSVLSQLEDRYRTQFPAVLTYKLSCDKKVLAQMRGRTLGNSATRLRSYLVEQHTEAWINCCVRFMATYKNFVVPGVSVPPPPALPQMAAVPSRKWFLRAYVTDSFSRLEEMRAKLTSVYGSILKMDSTKKITRKLAGHAAGTAECVTSVGNEYGQVLISVVTAAEGHGLKVMASGLVRRYRQAGQEPPTVLYVNRDCCCTTGGTPAALFSEWTQVLVRLDVCHFMRRLAAMVTTATHPLYGTFMRRLSAAIFAWDREDVALLKTAKDAVGPAAWSNISLREMARHCRRCTRGAAETERLIEEVLQHFGPVTDTMGIPLLDRHRMEGIWSVERRHLQCIQDPAGLQLYTRIGQVTVGGVSLPVLRCARGTTSLESFHLHLNRFIPGTSASALNFQVYLLEGLTRWNEDRGRAIVTGGGRQQQRSYSSRDMDAVNQLSEALYGIRLFGSYTQPREYTGELIGVSYLFDQTGRVLEDMPDDAEVPEEEEEEEELEEEEEEEELEKEEELEAGVEEDEEDEGVFQEYQSDMGSLEGPTVPLQDDSLHDDSLQEDASSQPGPSQAPDTMARPDVSATTSATVTTAATAAATAAATITTVSGDNAAAFAAAVAAAVAAAAATAATAAATRLPKTTAWKRRKLQQQRQEAERKGEDFKTKAPFSCICSLCKQPKTKQFGHSRFHSKKRRTMFHFCQKTAGGKTVEQWLEEKRREEEEEEEEQQ